MPNDKTYGVINEIGDMGLGFNPISEQEQQQVEEKEKEDAKENK